ncbi:taxadiene 5-alpha hydroxylase-like [Pistacia vera]|uniref:taxadiene 5-alpha hydroxylase-like n=1 Tax=Pistacia vera TaxID=55513 RepID=UPI0012638182|nr:taxadiene 5-alpha hydroxylase-like [Pistacia vera]
MGLPIIGNSLKFLHAMHTDTMEQWFHERIGQYGPINKLSLFGTPAVFLHGQAANKFVYTCDADTLGPQQPPSFKMICGERNILELNGDDHKRVRGMLMSFLKPEVLKQYVGKMDEEIRKHLEIHWHGKQNIAVMPSMKTLTFNIMSSLLFGIEQGASRDALIKLLRQIIDGSVSLAINLPFTSFRQGLQARAKFRSMILDLIHERRAALKHQTAVPHQDLITCLLSIRNSENSIILSDEEIVNNVIVLMIAGHDTSSVLITFLVRLLATNPTVYATIVQEQEEITKSKASGEHLTWDDLAKMKYTWRVALETLRMYPPVLGPFKKVLKDFEYEGFTIPQGWQIVLGASLTHMDEEIFPDPSRFDPTRFEKQASIPAYCFVGFGGGPRICPGYDFARLETLSTIHYLVTQFTWKLSCNDTFSRNPMPSFKRGLPIQI